MIPDLVTRLAGLGVPVLTPEERELPMKGGRAGQPGGLALYLQQHTGGYVQLSYPEPVITSGDVFDLSILPVECVGPDATTAQALASRVRTLLGRTPRRGGKIGTLSPPRTDLQAGSARCLLQFQLDSLAL